MRLLHKNCTTNSVKHMYIPEHTHIKYCFYCTVFTLIPIGKHSTYGWILFNAQQNKPENL